MTTTFGQLVCGPPGCGKSTYCMAMQQFLNAAGRPTAVVNLDPANDSLRYDCSANVTDLISLADVMEEHGLGPNGALMFCLEYLERNLDWLEDVVTRLRGHYLLFDCPGQAELYTHHASFFNIVRRLQALDFRLCAVHLVDVHHCGDASKFISAVLLSLTAMVRLELPHINVLTKVDTLASQGDLAFDLDFYAEAQDLHHIAALIRHESGSDADVDADSDTSAATAGSAVPEKGAGSSVATAIPLRRRRFMQRFARLNDKLVEIIQDHSLVSFLPMSIQDAESMLQVARLVDKSNGFVALRPVGTVQQAQAGAAADMLKAAQQWSELSRVHGEGGIG